MESNILLYGKITDYSQELYQIEPKIRANIFLGHKENAQKYIKETSYMKHRLISTLNKINKAEKILNSNGKLPTNVLIIRKNATIVTDRKYLKSKLISSLTKSKELLLLAKSV